MTKRQRKLLSPGFGIGRTAAPRRPATVLILVMTILGILFVMGVAFMATMSFEAELISVARERSVTQPVIDDVVAEVDAFITAGVDEVIDATSGQLIVDQPDSALEALSSIPFSGSPGRFNTLSPIEPFVDDPTLGKGLLVWGYSTDVRALAGIEADYFATNLRIDTAWKSGVDPGANYTPGLTPVDTDGDGIVDANQVNVELLGFTRRQIDPLAKTLNAASNPKGPVYLGLRVVPHGGMVNLAESHPMLIRKLLFMAPMDELPHQGQDFEPYSPLVEEASLRRRGMLPPRVLPPTQILGSLMDPDSDTGGADFGQLYWPNETVSDHRYYPFTPEEFNPQVHPNETIWYARMNPENAEPNNPNGGEYSRRHLVTSISYDDLLRRAVVVVDESDGDRKKDLIEWAINNGVTPNEFPYLDYPGGNNAFPNTYTGANKRFRRFDWNDCVNDPNHCELNPRKGRLRLSMAWLDKMWGLGEQPLAKRVIQDTFTLMLLNARGREWGKAVSVGPDRTVWEPDFEAISRAAAALTANMIDFADADDQPTAVEIRSANYTPPPPPPLPAPLGFGVGTGEFVYGLENQPYITEVAARAIENTNPGQFGADPAASSYAIELFNPYDDPIDLSDYSLRINTTRGFRSETKLSRSLESTEFRGYHWSGDAGDFSPATPLADLDFAAGSTIKLMRTLNDGTPIVVDEFNLANLTVGSFIAQGGDGNPVSIQRYATTGLTGRWYATVPDGPPESRSDTIGNPPSVLSPNWQPVEAIIANEGSFSEAFPTTGSLLLLMRYANAEDAAFTSRLSHGNLDPHPIDDGRMPIYDVEDDMFHHIDPSDHPTDLVGGVAAETKGQSGTVEHLPWGQLVFDYFTALPLDNTGPYGDHVGEPLEAIREQQPRVEQDGMRVHGRIDINAAPWFVMKGLPFIRMDLVPGGSSPGSFRDIFIPALDLLNTNNAIAQPIGPIRARAIAAYRDQRLIKSSDFSSGYKALSGNYDEDSVENFGRGWAEPAPKIRRGMGFLSIGELANVRHPAAVAEDVDEIRMRFDDGVVGMNDLNHAGTYLEAVAALACLSDWVSVRSQVFTAYGTLRGGFDPTIEHDDFEVQREMQRKDVDTRAIRFQETIDRLPTFLGADEPARIGSRVLAAYNDVRND